MKLKRKMERWFGKQHNALLIFALLFLSSGKLDAQIKAKPADKFVEMIGVCAHFATNFNQYTNSQGDSLREKTATGVATNIRIRHLRDGIYGWKGGTEDFDANGRGIVERFSAISKAGTDAEIPNGITWIITDNTDDWKRLRDNYLIPLGNKVIVLEGANENMGTSGDAQAYQQIKNWWNNILPSLPNLKIATNTGPTAACEIVNSGYIGDFVHYGNAHPYHFWPPFKPFGKLSHCNFNSSCAPPTVSLWTSPDNQGGTIGYLEATRKKRVRADQPMIFTEWGYPTSADVKQGWGVDEDVAAKYVLRGFLEHFNAGILYSCLYQLIDPEPELPFNDDAEAHFGLAFFDGTLKKSGLALKRIIELLEDGGNMNIPTHSLDYSLSGGGGLSFTDDKDATTNEIHQTLVQKADSTYYLILWQEAVSTNSKGKAINISPVDVTINFKTAISMLKAYLPATTDNTNPVADTTNIQRYTIAVPDHPVVIEILEKAGTVPVTGMSIVPDAVEMKIGGTVKLSPVITPENASVKRVTWSSSNSAAVSVDFTGTIKGLSAGTSTVIAKSINNDVMASCQVKVNSVPVNEVSISPTAITISTHENAQLVVNFIPADASNKAVNWISGDTSIVTVYENGLITGIATGNATIRVTTQDGNKEATCLVTVKDFTFVDDADGGWVWNGYSNDPCSTCYNGTAHSTNTINATAQFVFTGTEIAAYCETWSGGGFVDVYIDGVLKGSYSQAVPPFGGARQFARIEGLSDTSHTIKFVATSAEWTGIDFIRYIGTPPLKGLLTGTFGFSYTDVNLTDGTADWMHFGNNDQKANGSANSIINFQAIGGVAAVYADDLRKISWRDGTPTISSSNNTSGVNTSGIGNGFLFTTAAHNDTDTLNIYVSGNGAGGTLTAHLSNNSAADFEKTVATTRTSKWDGIFTLIYNATQEGKTLDIKWVQATEKGSIGLQAASISGKIITSTGNLNAKSSSILVYPNPFEKGLLSIKMSETGEKTICIIDITGKTVFNVQSANQLIQVPRSSFNRGIYLVTVSDIHNIQRDQLIVH